jgi:hypothetical protein
MKIFLSCSPRLARDIFFHVLNSVDPGLNVLRVLHGWSGRWSVKVSPRDLKHHATDGVYSTVGIGVGPIYRWWLFLASSTMCV